MVRLADVEEPLRTLLIHLDCPSFVGRPFGMPGDPAFQTGVVVAALRLLELDDTPVLHDYPVEADPGEEVSLAGLSCPVPYRNEASGQTGEERIAAAVALEIQGLRPWYDLAMKQQRNTFGVIGLEPEDLATFIAMFLSSDHPANPRPDLPLIHSLSSPWRTCMRITERPHWRSRDRFQPHVGLRRGSGATQPVGS